MPRKLKILKSVPADLKNKKEFTLQNLDVAKTISSHKANVGKYKK